MNLAKFHDAKNKPSCLVSSRAGSQTHDLLPLFPQSSTSSCGFGNSDLVHESIVGDELTIIVPTIITLTATEVADIVFLICSFLVRLFI